MVGVLERFQKGHLSCGIGDFPEFVCGSDLLVWMKFRVCERVLSLVSSGSSSLLILSFLHRKRLQF